MILTLKIAKQSFYTTLLLMMRNHTRFGYKRFDQSEDIVHISIKYQSKFRTNDANMNTIFANHCPFYSKSYIWSQILTSYITENVNYTFLHLLIFLFYIIVQTAIIDLWVYILFLQSFAHPVTSPTSPLKLKIKVSLSHSLGACKRQPRIHSNITGKHQRKTYFFFHDYKHNILHLVF